MRDICEIFLLAENRLLREALVRLLNKRKENGVIAASGYSPNILDEIVSARPHTVLLDSNGLSFSKGNFIPSLHLAIRNLRVVMVDMEPDESTFLTAVRAGVVGYVLKDASAMEVVATIRAVRAGQAVCPPSLSRFFFRHVAQNDHIAPCVWWAAELGLSRREQQMVELVGERLTNKEIAARLNLSEQTIKNHVHHILRKVGVSGRSGIVELREKQLSRYTNASHQDGLPPSLLTT